MTAHADLTTQHCMHAAVSNPRSLADNNKLQQPWHAAVQAAMRALLSWLCPSKFSTWLADLTAIVDSCLPIPACRTWQEVSSPVPPLAAAIGSAYMYTAAATAANTQRKPQACQPNCTSRSAVLWIPVSQSALMLASTHLDTPSCQSARVYCAHMVGFCSAYIQVHYGIIYVDCTCRTSI